MLLYGSRRIKKIPSVREKETYTFNCKQLHQIQNLTAHQHIHLALDSYISANQRFLLLILE